MGEETQLIQLISNVFDKKMKKYNEEYNFFNKHFWIGNVETVDLVGNTATVMLPNQTIATSSKQNKTNQTLVIGDEVWLFSPQGTLGSSFILLTNKTYV